jgi:hypothetical protein
MRSNVRCVLYDKGRPRTRIVVADHERLIVTYSTRDDAVYLFCPPGEDPGTVLAAARLVLRDDLYRELAAHIGVAPGWGLEQEPARRGRAG